MSKFVFHALQQFLGLFHGHLAIDNHMAGQRVSSARNRPNVQVVYMLNSLYGLNRSHDIRNFNARRCVFHQYADRLFDNPPSAEGNE